MTAVATAVAGVPLRVARPRRFLLCRPDFFDVTYSINPWMAPAKPTDQSLALLQWERLRSLLLGLGHEVDLIPARPGLPDMVFAANGATVVSGTVFSARFRHPERAEEGPAYATWFRRRGYPVHDAEHVNEGEGDLLLAGPRILAGTGFRTDPRAHAEAGRVLGREVVSLRLVDPRFYHLDTALAVLDDDQIMYYPAAFDPAGQAALRRLYPDAILANRRDAEAFGLNAVSDGRNVLLPSTAVGLAAALSARGYVPIGVDLSELLKAGGGAKCCVLEVRER